MCNYLLVETAAAVSFSVSSADWSTSDWNVIFLPEKLYDAKTNDSVKIYKIEFTLKSILLGAFLVSKGKSLTPSSSHDRNLDLGMLWGPRSKP